MIVRKTEFDVERVKSECVQWIRDYFEKNGKDCNAIVGISGGKDSSVVATLCVEALERDRVIGVLMPQGEQTDIEYSYKLVNHLGIRSYVIDIAMPVFNVLQSMKKTGIEPSEQTKVNLPARIRMATLFAVSQSCNGRVANTCNLSEDWIGYSTLFGDSVGQFAPISQLTASEVVLLGKALGLPDELIYKAPSDGLTGKTDEENFGFTYEVLDLYIRTGFCYDEEIKKKIDSKHRANKFKLEPMPFYDPGIMNYAA